MKKLIAFVLCAGMALSLSVAALAAEPMLISPGPTADEPMVISPGPAADEPQTGYALRIDGEDTGVRACIMVPLRAVAEKLGFEVVWNGDNTITVTGDVLYADLTIGEDRYFTAPTQEGVMGASLFSLGMAPYAINGTTYVPLGLFDALLGSQQGAVTMTDGAICLDTDPLGKIGGVQMPNPFAEYETLAEAARAAGVELTVPDAMRRRILENIDKMELEAAPRSKIIRFPSVKRLMPLAACFVLLLAGIFYARYFMPGETVDPVPSTPVMVGSPIMEVADVGALSETVGFPVKELTALPFRAEEVTYATFWKELAQITYTGEEKSVTFRQSVGDKDNSGDYNVYAETEVKEIGGVSVTLKGDGQAYSLAVWSDGTYAYSANVQPGLTVSEWEAVLTNIE